MRSPKFGRPNIQPTGYSLSHLPGDHQLHDHFTIHLEYRGDGLWRIRHRFWVLSRSGRWKIEGQNSSLTPYWLSKHRFPLSEALDRATRALPKLTFHGKDVGYYLLEHYGADPDGNAGTPAS